MAFHPYRTHKKTKQSPKAPRSLTIRPKVPSNNVPKPSWFEYRDDRGLDHYSDLADKYQPEFIPSTPPPDVTVVSCAYGVWKCHKDVLSRSAVYRKVFEDYPKTKRLYIDDCFCDGAILSFLYTGGVEAESHHNSYMWVYLRLFEAAKLHGMPEMQAYAKAKLEDRLEIGWGDYRPSCQCVELVYEELDGEAEDSRELQKLLVATHAVTTVKQYTDEPKKNHRSLEELCRKYPYFGPDLLAGLPRENWCWGSSDCCKLCKDYGGRT